MKTQNVNSFGAITKAFKSLENSFTESAQVFKEFGKALVKAGLSDLVDIFTAKPCSYCKGVKEFNNKYNGFNERFKYECPVCKGLGIME